MKRILILFLFLPMCVSALSDTVNRYVAGADRLNQKAQQSISNNIDSAGLYAFEALGIARKGKYKKGMAEAQAYLGVVYDIKGKADSALFFFQKAIAIQESLKDYQGLSYSYNNLGILYYAQYNYPKALFYYRKSLEADRKLNDKKGQAGTLVNMGIVYSYTDSISQSEKVYAEALHLYSDLGDSVGISHVWANQGKLMMMKKDYAGALDAFLRVQRFLEGTGKEEALCTNYISLANAYSKLKKHTPALDMCHQALLSAVKLGSAERRQFVYETYTDVYAAKGDYALAYAYLKKYTNLRDSILNENRNALITEMNARYETDKKDQHIKALQAEKENEIMKRREKEMLADKKSAQTQVIFLLLVAVVIIAGLIYWGYSNKQKLARKLEEQNKIISDHLKQKEMLVGEVHHRVKNNLQLISSILDLQAKSISDTNVATAIIESRNRVYSMSVLHQLLYQQNEITGIEMRPYFEKIVMGLFQTSAAGKEISFTNEVQNITLDIDTGIPLGLILNELVTNSLKYAFTGVDRPAVTVALKSEEGKLLLLMVSDNGKGTDVVAGEGTSFGFKLVKSLCRQLKAEWEISHSNGYTHVFKIGNFKQL